MAHAEFLQRHGYLASLVPGYSPPPYPGVRPVVPLVSEHGETRQGVASGRAAGSILLQPDGRAVPATTPSYMPRTSPVSLPNPDPFSPTPPIKVTVVQQPEIVRLSGDATPGTLADFLASVRRAWNREPGISAERKTDILLENIDKDVERGLRRWGRDLNQDPDLLVKRLGLLYGEKRSCRTLMMQLVSSRQAEGEGVLPFAYRVQENFFALVERQEVLGRGQTGRDILMETFVEGLCNVDLQRFLDQKYCDGHDFDELLSAAERWLSFEPPSAAETLVACATETEVSNSVGADHGTMKIEEVSDNLCSLTAGVGTLERHIEELVYRAVVTESKSVSAIDSHPPLSGLPAGLEDSDADAPPSKRRRRRRRKRGQRRKRQTLVASPPSLSSSFSSCEETVINKPKNKVSEIGEVETTYTKLKNTRPIDSYLAWYRNFRGS